MKLEKKHLWIVLGLFSLVLVFVGAMILKSQWDYITTGIDIESGKRAPSVKIENYDQKTLITTTGIFADISKWQGHWDCVKYLQKNDKLVIIRIGYSVGNGNYQDDHWKENTQCALSVGLEVLHYYYADPSGSVTAQAEFAANLHESSPYNYTPLIMDAESNGGRSTTSLATWYKTWLDIVQTKTGEEPIIYSACWFWDNNVANIYDWSNYYLWDANYSSTPEFVPCVPKPWNGQYFMLQWTSSGYGPDWGAESSRIDLNVSPYSWYEIIKMLNLDQEVSIDVEPGKYFVYSDVPFTITYFGGELGIEPLKLIYLPLTEK